MKLKFFLAAFAAFALLIASPQAHACGCCGNGVLDEGEQCDDGNRVNGDGCSAECEVECGGEGCTPGYWKQPQHLDSWETPGPDANFNAIFNTNAEFNEEQCGTTDPTLLEALKCQGGGLSALARHAAAALLNAGSGDVDYDYSVSQVLTMVKTAIDSGNYGGTKNDLATANELGCPLN
jgi:cysteine-rich repeat protein